MDKHNAYINTAEYYHSARKKKEMPPLATTWTNPEYHGRINTNGFAYVRSISQTHTNRKQNGGTRSCGEWENRELLFNGFSR